MRWAIGVALAAGIFGVTAASASACPVAGNYQMEGTNPNGSPYRGEVEITSYGSDCQVVWRTPQVSSGIGYVTSNWLEVRFSLGSSTGTAAYDIMSDGSLSGTWWMDSNPSAVGTERFYPAGSSRSTSSSGSSDSSDDAAVALGALLLLGILGAAADKEPAPQNECREQVISTDAAGNPNTIWVCD